MKPAYPYRRPELLVSVLALMAVRGWGSGQPEAPQKYELIDADCHLQRHGITSRLLILLRWLRKEKPDIACLQELRALQDRFPEAEIAKLGYQAVRHGQKSWNGVAILPRVATPLETRRGLPGDPDDTHSRYIEAPVKDILVGCVYPPNGNPAPGPKFDLQAGLVQAARRTGFQKYARAFCFGKPTIIEFPQVVSEMQLGKVLLRQTGPELAGICGAQAWSHEIRHATFIFDRTTPLRNLVAAERVQSLRCKWGCRLDT